MVAPITVTQDFHPVTLAETTAIRIVDGDGRCHIAACRVPRPSVGAATTGILAGMTSQTPIDIATALLDGLARDDIDAALGVVDDDIDYTNVSMPTVRGKKRVGKIFAPMARNSRVGFNYRMVNVSADGPVVLTERVDEIRIGRVHLQFWVCGRFEVREGRIVVWRDYFDYLDFTKAIVRGLVGAVIPAVVRPLPVRRQVGGVQSIG